MNILGGGMQLAGAFMGGKAADSRRKQLEKIAETPGLDLTSLYGETTGAGQAALPGANALTGGMNQGALTNLLDILNQAIPGYSAMQGTRAGAVGSMLKGEIPQDVAAQVFRRGAGKALAGGYGGTEMGRNLVARDLGLTSLDILGRGMSGMESLIGTTPLPRMTQASDVLNLTGRDTMGLRSGERSEKLNMMLGAANAPRSSDVWAKAITDMGGQVSGLGPGFGGGGGAGGGGLGGLGSIMGILGMI